MDSDAEFIRSEIADIAELVRVQCKLESERRGHAIGPSDPVIQERVADLILQKEGEEIRKKHQS